MTSHLTGTREEWLAARLRLLDAEKELTRRGDEVARQRQELPWVRIEKDYRFETEDGEASFADLFRGRSQLVVLMAVSQAPIDAIQAYRRRMGWTFPWASSLGSEFNYDFDVSITEEQQRLGAGEYNYRPREPFAGGDGGPALMAAATGTDTATYLRQSPGVSAFAFEDGVVYHTYSGYARGLDALWGMYQWLDRAPKGRNEEGLWFRRRDEYEEVR